MQAFMASTHARKAAGLYTYATDVHKGRVGNLRERKRKKERKKKRDTGGQTRNKKGRAWDTQCVFSTPPKVVQLPLPQGKR